MTETKEMKDLKLSVKSVIIFMLIIIAILVSIHIVELYLNSPQDAVPKYKQECYNHGGQFLDYRCVAIDKEGYKIYWEYDEKLGWYKVRA